MTVATGIPALDAALVWGGAVSVLAGLGTVAWRLIRGGVRLGRRVDDFIDDWSGEPQRPGRPARPGVMERMSGIERRLARVEHELHPNSGTSLRDAVDLANHRLTRLCPDEDCRHPAPDDLHHGPAGDDHDDGGESGDRAPGPRPAGPDEP